MCWIRFVPFVDQSVDHLWCDVFNKFVIDLENWSGAARGKTFSGHQCVISIGCGLAAFNTQALLKVLDQRITVAQVARDTGANLYDFSTRRLLVIHGVKGGYALDIIDGQANRFGYRLQSLLGDITFFLLCDIERWHNARKRPSIINGRASRLANDGARTCIR